ncbi:MAG: flagellar biosynthetic protein FliO [Caloramator sp.]|nr:flagellar biosynthetic protein FliO [Caloramator sp.]
MDYSFFYELLKIIVLMPLIIFLIYITFNFGEKYLKKLNNKRIIKIYEKVPMGQNTYLSVVCIDDKVYLISSSNNGIRILKELDSKSILIYENKGEPLFGDYLNIIKRKKYNE